MLLAVARGVVGEMVPLMAVLDRSGREGRDGRDTRIRRAAIRCTSAKTTYRCCSCNPQTRAATHGPRSDGVSGLEGGGGRLIKVGVGMMFVNVAFAGTDRGWM